MGRKRIEESKKKIPVKLSLLKSDVEELREQDINISKLVQTFLTEYLHKNSEKQL